MQPLIGENLKISDIFFSEFVACRQLFEFVGRKNLRMMGTKAKIAILRFERKQNVFQIQFIKNNVENC